MVETKEKELTMYARALIDLTAKLCHCSAQYNGSPCNTCFHTTIPLDLGLSNEMTHKLWEIVLVLRGDYTEQEIKDNEPEPKCEGCGLNLVDGETVVKGENRHTTCN